MEPANRYLNGINDLQRYRNYYTLEKVEDFHHRFEVFYSSFFGDREVNYVIMLRGNTPESIRGYPYDGPVPAAFGDGAQSEKGGKIVDGEPERFRTVAPIAGELAPLAEAVAAYIRKQNGNPLKIRYDGFKRQITFNEIIPLRGDVHHSLSKHCLLKAFHASNTEMMELGEREMGVGITREMSTAFIPFYPSDQVQGRMLFCGFDAIPSFKADWQNFSHIALGFIDRNERIPFPLIPNTFKFYVYYTINCIGRKPLQDQRVGIPFKFFQDDQASCREKFAFELSEVLQKTVEQTRDVPALNLKLSVAMNLKEMRLFYKIKGPQKEQSGTIAFTGKIDLYQGLPVLESSLKATVSESEMKGAKRKSSPFQIQIMDGQKYEYIDVNPDRGIDPVGS